MILLVRPSKAWRSKHIGRMPSLLRSFGGSLLPRRGWRSTLFSKKHEIFDYSVADFGQDREALRELRMREARS